MSTVKRISACLAVACLAIAQSLAAQDAVVGQGSIVLDLSVLNAAEEIRFEATVDDLERFGDVAIIPGENWRQVQEGLEGARPDIRDALLIDLTRKELFFQVMDPRVTEDLLDRALAQSPACAGPETDPLACREQSDAIAVFRQDLGRPTSVQCGVAAKKFREAVARCGGGCSPADLEIFAEFDARCMATPHAWRKSPQEPYRSDPLPLALQARGAAAGAGGPLDAVVAIRRETQLGADHVCGGLLLAPERPGETNRVLTARHCFDRGEARAALAAGRVHVQRLGGGDAYTLSGAPPSGVTHRVAEDFVILHLVVGSPVLATPRVRFARPVPGRPVLAVSYFPQHDAGRTLEQDLQNQWPAWRRGVRWSRPEMCRVLAYQGGCVRFLCQTVPGFSGTPLIDQEPDAAGALVIRGLVSHPARTGSAYCAAPRLTDADDENSTTAAFPEALIQTGRLP